MGASVVNIVSVLSCVDAVRSVMVRVCRICGVPVGKCPARQALRAVVDRLRDRLRGFAL